MEKGQYGFVYPKINQELCINCGLCEKKCPSNIDNEGNMVKTVFASWALDKITRKNSTSGGVFTLLCKRILAEGGFVVGVAWDDNYHPHHIIIDDIDEIELLQGSKYVQSRMGDTYNAIKKLLEDGKKVLFSGTPCQNAALKSFLSKEYENLYLIDIVCHGVPSTEMFDKYISKFHDRVKSISLRKKMPYWDYSYVYIEFDSSKPYRALTIDDDYFNLFNIGYSLRSSCHTCKYTSINRQSDLTLADFWGFMAHNYNTRNYNKGTSLILVNTEKGAYLFDSIKDGLYFETSSIDKAKKGNKCLSEPFSIEKNKLDMFWHDYENGMSVKELNDKFCAHTFTKDKLLILKRPYYKWKWIFNK